MSRIKTNDKLYPIHKVTLVVDALAEEGVRPTDALEGTGISVDALRSPDSNVSLIQVVDVFRNVARLAPDPSFACRTGLRFHVSTYGMYGFALLSSDNFRHSQSMAIKYHSLATPLLDLSFKEEGKRATWSFSPLPDLKADGALYRFLVELHAGLTVSLQRDVMGSAFVPDIVHVTFRDAGSGMSNLLGCEVRYKESANEIHFDAGWLDRLPLLGNAITLTTVERACGELLEDLRYRSGMAGRVRDLVVSNLRKNVSLDVVSKELHIPVRTLRRSLANEGTSFREILEQVRIQLSIKLIRDTDMIIDDIAAEIGFGDASSFRHAFVRWTNKSPRQFRRSNDLG